MTIRDRVLTAVRWSALSRLFSQLVTWGSTLIVIRLLTKDDYGVIGLTSVIVGLPVLLGELGVAAALTQARTASHNELRRAAGLIMLVNLVFAGLLILTAPGIVQIYPPEDLGKFSHDEVALVIQALALQLPLTALGVVPLASLKRELHFKQVAIADASGLIIGSAVSLLVAWQRGDVWALVAAAVVLALVRTVVGLFYCRPIVLPSFGSFRDLSKLAPFARSFTFQRLIWWANANIERLILSLFLGVGPTGLYTVAQNIASMPVSKTMFILNDVAFPAYARLQDDLPAVRNYYIRSVQAVLFLFVPMLWGLAAVAPHFINTVLGEEWAMASAILTIVCVGIPFRLVSNLTTPMLNGLGRAGVSAQNVLTTFLFLLPLLVVGILIGQRQGNEQALIGACVAIITAYAVSMLINVHRALRIVGSSWGDFLTPSVPTFFNSMIMVGLVLYLQRASGVSDPAVCLLIGVTGGVLIYAISSYIWNRESVALALRLLRGGSWVSDSESKSENGPTPGPDTTSGSSASGSTAATPAAGGPQSTPS